MESGLQTNVFSFALPTQNRDGMARPKIVALVVGLLNTFGGLKYVLIYSLGDCMPINNVWHFHMYTVGGSSLLQAHITLSEAVNPSGE